MKFIGVPLCLLLASHSFCRDFRPEVRFESVPAADESVQKCYVIQTTAGLRYRVETSNDLINWTPREEFYGLGNEYVVTLLEEAGAPGSLPGSPSSPPVFPTNASLRVRPATGGGTVIAWPSLDGGGPVVFKIAGEMDPAWESLTGFVDAYADHTFFISHPPGSVEPPAVNPPLGSKDAAMIAALETHWPAINLQVVSSATRARNAPLPGPSDPDDKAFWRVNVDWGVDTDGDGSPDWAEFEMIASGAGVLETGVSPDPFAADTNGDGIPDGAQLDTDGDGTPDGLDPAPEDDTASFPMGPQPRYAMFPINGVDLTGTYLEKALQINDNGRVLYGTGTWAAGVWTPLELPPGNIFPGHYSAQAFGINDHDVILGGAFFPHEGDPLGRSDRAFCYWPGPEEDAVKVESSTGALPLVPGYSVSSASLLSNDGRFSGPTYEWGLEYPDDSYERPLFVRHSVWTLPVGDATVSSETAGDPGMNSHQSPDLSWGYTTQLDSNGNNISTTNTVKTPAELAGLAFVPYNVAMTPNGYLALPWPGSREIPSAYVDGMWKLASIYQGAHDISGDGTAIGIAANSSASVLINGKWQSLDRLAPVLPSRWKDSTVALLDTTRNGWILAERGTYQDPSYENAVMLPIQVDGVNADLVSPEPSPGGTSPKPPEFLTGGVDRISMTAEGGMGRVPQMWIMAPFEGYNQVRFKVPASPSGPLRLVSHNQLKFAPELLGTNGNSHGDIIQVSAESVAGVGNASQDVVPQLKIGESLESVSHPIGVKLMKKRTVKIALHQVQGLGDNSVRTLPQHMPTKGALEEYLNKVFGKQVNAFFEVTLFEESGPNRPHEEEEGIDFDLNNDHVLMVSGENSELLAATPNARVGLAPAKINIDIWVIGGNVSLLYLDTDFVIKRALGVTIANSAKIIIDGDMANRIDIPDKLNIPDDHKSARILHTIAHEIGHVISDRRHADESDCQSFLHWEDASISNIMVKKRLMCSGFKMDLKNPGEILIKKEWDRIESWLKKQEDDGEL